MSALPFLSPRPAYPCCRSRPFSSVLAVSVLRFRSRRFRTVVSVLRFRAVVSVSLFPHRRLRTSLPRRRFGIAASAPPSPHFASAPRFGIAASAPSVWGEP